MYSSFEEIIRLSLQTKRCPFIVIELNLCQNTNDLAYRSWHCKYLHPRTISNCELKTGANLYRKNMFRLLCSILWFPKTCYHLLSAQVRFIHFQLSALTQNCRFSFFSNQIRGVKISLESGGIRPSSSSSASDHSNPRPRLQRLGIETNKPSSGQTACANGA